MNIGKFQRLFGQIPRLARTGVAPRCDVAEVFVVALGLAIGSLVLLAEMAAAGFVAFQRVDAQQLAEFEKVRDAAGFFEALI